MGNLQMPINIQDRVSVNE